MDTKKFISKLINNSQERVIWYKKQMQVVFKDKDLYPEWYKEFLRDNLNFEKGWLKSLQEESYWVNII